jgi:hypothetical protein
VGYITTSVMLNESHDFLRLVINSIRNDLVSPSEAFQCLALTCVANVGGREFAEALSGDVQKLLVRLQGSICPAATALTGQAEGVGGPNLPAKCGCLRRAGAAHVRPCEQPSGTSDGPAAYPPPVKY